MGSSELAKVFNVFKKGFRLDPGSYRGISTSIMNTLAKLYDYGFGSENLNLHVAKVCEKSVVSTKPLNKSADCESDEDIKSTEIYKNCILPLLRYLQNMDSKL